MKVLQTAKDIGYPDDFRKFLDFKRFEKDCGDFTLSEGFFEEAHQWEQFHLPQKKLDAILKGRVMRLEIEEPNKFNLGDNPDSYDKYFEVIYTICPYTTKWLNRRQGVNRRIPIYYPTNENYIPKKTKKLYDVIYIGNLVSKRLLNDLQSISKYKYKWVGFSKHPLLTDRNVSYTNKLKLLSQSKIAIVHNVLFPRWYHVLNIWRAQDWQKNQAFKFVPRWYEFWKLFNLDDVLIPQAKTRLFESALSRTLILCKKDPFNVIERFFEPEKEFIYYKEGELEKTIDEILKNYPKYEKVAERAFQRAKKNYTTKAFVRDYLKKL